MCIFPLDIMRRSAEHGYINCRIVSPCVHAEIVFGDSVVHLIPFSHWHVYKALKMGTFTRLLLITQHIVHPERNIIDHAARRGHTVKRNVTASEIEYKLMDYVYYATEPGLIIN